MQNSLQSPAIEGTDRIWKHYGLRRDICLARKIQKNNKQPAKEQIRVPYSQIRYFIFTIYHWYKCDPVFQIVTHAICNLVLKLHNQMSNCVNHSTIVTLFYNTTHWATQFNIGLLTHYSQN